MASRSTYQPIPKQVSLAFGSVSGTVVTAPTVIATLASQANGLVISNSLVGGPVMLTLSFPVNGGAAPAAGAVNYIELPAILATTSPYVLNLDLNAYGLRLDAGTIIGVYLVSGTTLTAGKLCVTAQ